MGTPTARSDDASATLAAAPSATPYPRATDAGPPAPWRRQLDPPTLFLPRPWRGLDSFH